MSKVVPVLGTLGAGGALGGGIALSSKLLSNTQRESIKDRLEKDKYQILNTKASDHWTNIIESYKKTENVWKLEGKDISDVETLKSVCESKATSDYSEDLYKSFTKWCVVPRTAEDLLKGSFTLLESDDTHATDKEKWKHNVEAYESAKSGEQYSLKDVSFKDKNGEDDKTKALKTGCKTRKGKFTYDVDLDSSIKEIKEWCLAKSQPNS
ncbi:hypothetical protein HF1_04430 [Mycoplasma haemofelis str. Langford 1]|uniref:Uncharacterized protein n=1 Tax=Mycoplasma haemofelis (strain Langford 1) TaxID=941640 RepID=E8ZH30_MYCHL|nr:hypothetical protein [Mycoplasma haemofelis]CBY92451.1 hypothetical protein HF1_04430 [Mycoplasma haemofelis str. Langford 1]